MAQIDDDIAYPPAAIAAGQEMLAEMGDGSTGKVTSDSILAADAVIQADLDAHEADTTAVHGIADTSALLTTADIGGSVASQSDVAGKVSKTGDTMTGALTISTNSPTVNLVDANAPADTGRFRIYSNDGSLLIQGRTDADVADYSPLGIHRNSKVLDLSANSSVAVPANTAAGQAAQITAFDPATGRLAIGGVEMGETPWIEGTLLNGWTALACRYRRERNNVLIQIVALDGSAATSDTFLSLPSAGFAQDSTQKSNINSNQSVSATFVAINISGNPPAFSATRPSTGATGMVRYTTSSAWPTSI